jgi:nucleotide-binding universal stress UspA family protein
MKLLIAYDGSDYAKAAIRDLRRSGIPDDATALVTTVGEPAAITVGTPSLDPSIARRTDAALTQGRQDSAVSLSQAEELAQEGIALIAGLFAGWNVTTHVRLGKPAEVIIDSADAWSADLTVVGAQGRSALGRLLIGSVSQHVATKSPRSVLVARRVIDRGDNPVRLVMGIDGSSSQAAVEAVAARNWSDGTEVHVVAVAGTHRSNAAAKRVPTAAAWIDESNQEQRDTARAAMEHAVRLLAEKGLRVSDHFVEGTAQRILNDHAAKYDADCIFVGGQAFSGVLPNPGPAHVINALATSAPCSVEIVR